MFSKHTSKIGLVLILAAALSNTTMAARRNTADVIVVPSRYTIVQLAFDIVALRDVALVAYGNSATTGELLLHVWDANNRKWKRITVDEYAVGAFSSHVPDEMILVGSDNDLPAAIIAGASQASNVTRIDTLNLVTVVNTLHKRMHFKEHEWQLLAERHGLKIKDANYERRRWGRYGPPGTKKTPESAQLPEEETEEPETVEPARLGPVEEQGLPQVETPKAVEPKAAVEAMPDTQEDAGKGSAEVMEAEDAIIDSTLETAEAPEDK